jgi:isocitrate/isopropylmalate dehydrogenase
MPAGSHPASIPCVHRLHAAASVEAAADAAMLDPGSRTADLGGSAKTQVFTKAVIRSMRE